VHQLQEDLLMLISLGENVYLWGAPGSGKSTAAKKCAEALNLRWGYIALNPQTPESRLIGYMDAKGSYVRSLFRDVYENGGVFCIDEMDNASAGLVTTLNSGLENGHMAFPDDVIARHQDFVLVATGNTNGKGGNAMFPERRPFDAAFSERFVFLRWEYDENLEHALTMAHNPNASGWLMWVRQVRDYCAQELPARSGVPPRCHQGRKAA
jgi:cobaltochelatase CobS